MEDELNDVQSHEMHSEDDKALQENNKKRIVKTHAQVQALEKFYNEHKYPTETMKMQLAESIGLSEKQVSGWFCHRRLKDKKLTNGESQVIGRQDRSSGVVQDRSNGHRQDSCGSTKQVNDRNVETREVDSRRLASVGTHNRIDDVSSGSDSSLRMMSNHHKGDPVDITTSRYSVPKFPIDTSGVKARPGPAGYLKVKGQVENSTITAVKRQLGKHYREDGPPLGVEFDPLPPGAIESSMHYPADDETCYTGDAVLPSSPEFTKIHHHPKYGQGCESGYKSSIISHNLSMDKTSFKRPSEIPDNYVQQKFKQNASFSDNGSYYPRRSSFAEFSDAREMSVSESRDYYGTKYRKTGDNTFDGNLGRELESSYHKFNDVRQKISKEEIIENGSSNLTMKVFEHKNSFDQMQPRGPTQISKDGKNYVERRMSNENQIRIPYKNDQNAMKRMRDDIPLQLHLKKSSLLDNQLRTYQVTRPVAEIAPGFSEDEASVETSSSVE